MKYNKADYFVPLEECSKEENETGVSEYDTMLAISHMPEEFDDAQLQEELHKVVINRGLGDLVDKGLVEAVWDPVAEAVRFYAKV